MKKSNLSHDENFKYNFKDIKVVIDFLKHNLPQSILEKIDLNTVKLLNVEQSSSQVQSRRQVDVLCSVKDKKGKEVFAIIQIEAQSSPDKHMAMRLLEYYVAIARSYLKSEGADRIPLILSFVLYYGKVKWQGPVRLLDLLKQIEDMIQMLKHTFLINVGEKSLEDLEKQESAAAPQMFMKGRAQGTYLDMLPTLYAKMVEYGQDTLENIDYIVTHESQYEKELFDKLCKLDPEKITTYTEMFEKAKKIGEAIGEARGEARGKKIGEAMGEARGEARGKKIGKKEGIIEATAKIAKNLLKKGLDFSFISETTGLSNTQIKALK